MTGTGLPLVGTQDPGIYQECTVANTDYVITIPANAEGFVIWFETSASVATMLRGRVGIDQLVTAVTGITGTDVKLGYHPPQAREYAVKKGKFNTRTRAVTRNDAYLHVANATALAVVRGFWLLTKNL